MRKLLYFILTITLIVGHGGCKKEKSSDNIPFTTNIKEDSTIYLSVNNTYKITITPDDAQVTYSATIDNTYKLPQKGVISISPNGEIKALEAGKVSVVVKNNSSQSNFNIIVVELPTKIQLKDSSILIKTGRNTDLELNRVYDQYEQKYFGGLKWEITDNTIATVSELGKVTALKEGETKVRVSLKNYPNIYSEYPVHIMDYIVYVLGECQNEQNYGKVCYWKNNVTVESKLGNIAFTASDILYLNSDIYIVGRSFTPNKAYMLKNSTETIFNESGAGATGVALMDNDIYTSGYYTFNNILTVALWKNNALSPLLDNSEITSESIGTSIAVSNGNTYVGGYIKNAQGGKVACYWKNKQRIDLSDGLTNAIVNSIFVEGNDVYAAGEYNGVACYWKNGVKTDLLGTVSSVNAIYVSGGNIYTTGNYYKNSRPLACYWKNGSLLGLALPSSAEWSNTTSIKTADNNVFISGFYCDSNNKPIGCYWKNGIRVDIPPTKFKNGSDVEIYPYSSANCLAID